MASCSPTRQRARCSSLNSHSNSRTPAAPVRRSVRRHGVAAIVLLSGLAAAPPAAADPQWNTALVPSGCLLGDRGAVFDRTAFCGAVRADVLFLRERTGDFGLGPYVSFGTAAFEDFRPSVGISALLPIIDDFPVVLSGGLVLRDLQHPGWSSSLFWGLRSYNFHGTYNLAFGVVLGMERDFSDPSRSAATIGFHVDGFLLALPGLLLLGAFR